MCHEGSVGCDGLPYPLQGIEFLTLVTQLEVEYVTAVIVGVGLHLADSLSGLDGIAGLDRQRADACIDGDVFAMAYHDDIIVTGLVEHGRYSAVGYGTGTTVG